ncbi:MAG: phosphoribosylglycinamide synthetase C domain-containing protein, partial [Pontimonas sp.]
IKIAHAATAHTDDGLIATGGRVVSVIATGPNFDTARQSAYQALEAISLQGGHYRLDIAQGVSDDQPG